MEEHTHFVKNFYLVKMITKANFKMRNCSYCIPYEKTFSETKNKNNNDVSVMPCFIEFKKDIFTIQNKNKPTTTRTKIVYETPANKIVYFINDSLANKQSSVQCTAFALSFRDDFYYYWWKQIFFRSFFFFLVSLFITILLRINVNGCSEIHSCFSSISVSFSYYKKNDRMLLNVSNQNGKLTQWICNTKKSKK